MCWVRKQGKRTLPEDTKIEEEKCHSPLQNFHSRWGEPFTWLRSTALDHGTVNRCNYCKAPIEKTSSSTVQVVLRDISLRTYFLNGVRFDLRECKHILPQYICE